MNKGFRIIYPGGEVEFPCEEKALTVIMCHCVKDQYEFHASASYNEGDTRIRKIWIPLCHPVQGDIIHIRYGDITAPDCTPASIEKKTTNDRVRKIPDKLTRFRELEKTLKNKGLINN